MLQTYSSRDLSCISCSLAAEYREIIQHILNSKEELYQYLQQLRYDIMKKLVVVGPDN